MPPVIVNLRVGASADGSITVFSEAENAPTTNIIDTAYSLPVGALYNKPNDGTVGNNALFKFQGRTTDEGEEIIVGTYGDNFTTNVSLLTEYIASVMVNTLNCGPDTSEYANAEPFTDLKYSGIREYQTFNSIGDLTLATYAHYLFGHVQATAAIDNDSSLITYMNGNDPDDTIVEYTRPNNTIGTTGATKANIAYNLANKIISGLTDDDITIIVNNVIKQDASRARFEDNDLNNPDSWQHLEFKPNDVIFVQVTLDPPRLSFGNGDQQYQNNVPNISAISYNFRITMTETGGLLDSNGTPSPSPTNISVTSTTASASLTAATSYRFTNNTDRTILITLLNNSTPIAGSPVTLTVGQTSSTITGASSYTVTTPPPPNLYYEAFIYKGTITNASTVTRTYFESQMGGSVPTSWWKINEVTATNSRQFILTDYINGVLTSTALGLPDASGTSTRAFMINNTLLNLGFTYSTNDNLFIIEYVKSSVLNENYISDFINRLVSGTSYNVGTAAAAILIPTTNESTKGNVTVNNDLSVNAISLTKPVTGFDYESTNTYGASDIELKFTLDSTTTQISSGYMFIGFRSTINNYSFTITISKSSIDSFHTASSDPKTGVTSQFYPGNANKGLTALAGHIIGIRYVASTRKVTLWDYTDNISLVAGRTSSDGSFESINVSEATTYRAWIHNELTMINSTSTYTISNISLNSSW